MNSKIIFILFLFVIIACKTDGQHESDMQALERLINRINRNGDINDPSTPRPLVTLEEFFEGNNDNGSIGYNFYPEQPSPQDFYKVLLEIRNKSEVHDVRVQVQDHTEPGAWPSTDTIWIITSEDAKTVESWVPDLYRPDDVVIGFSLDLATSYEPYPIPEGMQAIGIWWD